MTAEALLKQIYDRFSGYAKQNADSFSDVIYIMWDEKRCLKEVIEDVLKIERPHFNNEEEE